MIKIFHGTDWTDYNTFYKNYINPIYTKYSSDKIIPVLNFREADFLIITNKLATVTGIKEDEINLKKVILHQYEPQATCKKWGKWDDKAIMDNLLYRFFDLDRNRSIVWPYFDVKALSFRPYNIHIGERKDKLGYISSLWNSHQGHKIRNSFLDYLHNVEYDYDLYGGKQYTAIGKTIDQFRQWKDSVDNKHEVINNYNYFLAIENTSEINWFSEKLWDNIICECLTFYWGCPTLEKFLPPESFIRLPLDTSFETSLQIIKDAIANNEREKRLKYILEAKDLLLHKYDLIHTIEELVS